MAREASWETYPSQGRNSMVLIEEDEEEEERNEV